MAQLVRAPPCHGGGRGFESHSGRLQKALVADCLIKLSWDHSSAGRASALQAEGHRFEPYWSHYNLKVVSYIEYGWIPEWPKGTDCKSAAICFGGSNPPPPIAYLKKMCYNEISSRDGAVW